jgi:hypothetical protein
MKPSLLTVLRWTATVALAGVTAAYAQYPGEHWMPIAIAVCGFIGTHAPTAVSAIQNRSASAPPAVQQVQQPKE